MAIVKFSRGTMADFMKLHEKTCRVEEIRMNEDGRVFFITDGEYIDLNDNLLYNLNRNEENEMKIQPIYEGEGNMFLESL